MAAKSKSSDTKIIRNEPPVHKGKLTVIRLLVLVAMGISGYLAYVSLTGDRVAGCGPDSACEQVLTSKWAYWLNIPVSVFALMTYSVILGASFRLGLKRDVKVQRATWVWLMSGAMLVFGAAAWFVGIQVFLLKSICAYCMTAHACGAIASILIFVSAPLRGADAKPWELEKLVFIAPRVFRRIAVATVALLAVLIYGQVKFERQTMVLKPALVGTNTIVASHTTAAAATTTNIAIEPPQPVTAVTSPPTPVPPAASSTPALPSVAPKRMLPIYGGRFELDVMDLPTMGAPTNQQVIVSLFDYTCHHCRSMHPLLAEAQRMFSNQLAVVSLPMPLDPLCNPTMRRANPAHTNACALAKLSLAVWRADRTKHPEYDEWIMTGEKPPALPDAEAKAAELVGEPMLRQAMLDPWVNNQLQTDIAIYEVAYQAGRGQMPQLIVGMNVALGSYTKPELIKMLVENLGLNLKE